jgi:hypothetical protein
VFASLRDAATSAGAMSRVVDLEARQHRRVMAVAVAAALGHGVTGLGWSRSRATHFQSFSIVDGWK